MNMHLAAAATAIILFSAASAEPLFIEESEQAAFRVDVVAEGMEFPWDMTVLPSGDILISEYDGSLRIFRDGTFDPTVIPAIEKTTERGGLRGIEIHPDFANNGFIYFCYARGTNNQNHTEIARGTFDGAKVSDVEVIFRADNEARELAHFGCRLLFDKEGMLIATLGDRRHHTEESQRLNDHYGVILRLDEEGAPAPGNPKFDDNNARAENFAYGIRNAQGAVFHPETGELWVSEHGPRGGDEINIIRPGENYGWPVATYGNDYTGEEMSHTPLLEGTTPPLFYWYPSIAPSSIAFYDGEDFPKWRGDIFVTTLSSRRLLRLEVIGDRIVRVEELFSSFDERLRNVEMGPGGELYVLTDAGDGRLLKISPIDAETD